MTNLLHKERNGIFSKEVAELEATVWRKRLFQSAVTALSIGLPLTALLVPNQATDQKIKELGMGAMLGVASTLLSQLRDQDEKRYESFNSLNTEHFKGTIKSVFDYERNIQFVRNRLNLADTISTLSDGAQEKFGRDFQITELITRSVSYDDVEVEAEVLPEIAISPQTLQLEQQKQAVEIKTKIDLSWLDSEFIAGSKVVVGGRGSGKSYYLKYEAARYLLENPQDTLLILDPHFDPSEKPENQWLNNLPLEVIKKYVVAKKPSDIYKQMVNVIEELDRRIENNLKPPHVPRIKIILDEEETIKRQLDNDKFDIFLDVIGRIQDEARKYGINITISMHSLKKENTGIDSANLSQMDWLLFEKAAYDSATKYPSDFNAKRIKVDAKKLHAVLPKNLGRVIVVIKQMDADARTTVLPLLPIPVITIEPDTQTEDVDPEQTANNQDIKPDLLTVITNWYYSIFEEYGHFPNDATLATAWKEITGQELHDWGITELRELIEKHKGEQQSESN